jgi:hypothetical protein
MKSALPALLCALILLGGCAGNTHQSPSLAPRAIEKISLDDPAPQPPEAPTAAPDADMQTQIDGFSARIDQGARAFDSLLPAARTAIASGGKAADGSEAWLTAQQHYTALQSAAGLSSGALSDIDELYLARVDAATGGGSSAGLDALRAIRERAARQVETQRATLDTLGAAFSR